MAIEQVVAAPRSPWQNAYVERIIGTSSSPMSITCAVCCRHTLSITTEAARISR
ncbi:hypothetical protein [Reyranella sp.]|uniref:hypothetical protein n=1 Tax=Reyranella sp. TaxID=1929291 RepID=UPI00271ECE19|nr:hypothetical protein [Reyranella sp.]MDO8975441.1 hypothetical protein [Reyranella sp.]